MQITLNLKDETEFLAEVKEIVRSQIKQLAREEVAVLFKEEIARIVENKMKSFSVNDINLYVKDVLGAKLRATLGGSWYSDELVKKEAVELVKNITNEQLRSFDFKKNAFAALDAVAGSVKTEVLNNFKKMLDK